MVKLQFVELVSRVRFSLATLTGIEEIIRTNKVVKSVRTWYTFGMKNKVIYIVGVVAVLLLLGYYFGISQKQATQIKSTPTTGSLGQDIAQIEMSDVSGLYGGYEVSVNSAGDTSVRKIFQGTISYEEKGNQANFERLVRSLSENKFEDIKNIAIKGLPDESSAKISVTMLSGEKKVISQSYNEMTTEFRAIHKVFIDIATEELSKPNKPQSVVHQ